MQENVQGSEPRSFWNLPLPFACLVCHCLMCSCSLVDDETPGEKGRRVSLPVVSRATLVSSPQTGSEPQEPTTATMMGWGLAVSEETSQIPKRNKNTSWLLGSTLFPTGAALQLSLEQDTLPGSSSWHCLETLEALGSSLEASHRGRWRAKAASSPTGPHQLSQTQPEAVGTTGRNAHTSYPLCLLWAHWQAVSLMSQMRRAGSHQKLVHPL